MDNILTAVLAALGAGAIAGLTGFYLRNVLAGRARDSALEAAERQVRRADERSKEILLEAKEEALRVRTTTEADLRSQRQELQRHEARLEQKEENIDRKAEVLEARETEQKRSESEVERERQELTALRSQEMERLESLSGLLLNDAKQLLLGRAEEEIQFDLARRFRAAETRAHEEADERSREILSQAIQRLASEVVSEASVSTIPLPNDEMKGRLIGREGRNIRAIEAATGVDLIVDDVPEAVTVSCFDPIRRQVAKQTIEGLVKDGRIHPARVEEMVERARRDVDETIRKAGEQAMFDVSVKGLHPELIKLIGRLKYRYSYGENVLQHSTEVSLLAGLIAAEIGADVSVSKTAGFLHDIGKGLSHEVEGPHAEIGADLVSKYSMPAAVELAIREHHDREMTSTESFIVAAADAISAARPGARRDTVEAYIQRLEALEEVARGFDGVERCYAIQAGREVRVIVQPATVDDATAAVLARDIARRVEETLAYPGQIRVVVIRESRAVEVAR